MQNQVEAFQSAYTAGARTIVFIGPSLDGAAARVIREHSSSRLIVAWPEDADPPVSEEAKKLAVAMNGKVLLFK
ncbi:MAG: hypothetical protein GVY16_06345 [Planctomycetes bacterium]|jgi:hypothetical protein|nr:hypothetical protein [Planctomycetota bacterium]